MTRQMLLSAFVMSTVSHVVPGLWRHPEDLSSRYTDLSYWTELARLLDGAGFDMLFIADALGQVDVYGGRPDAALRAGLQSPLGDPIPAISAMAAVTERLGFGVTQSTTYEQPYALARRFTTLDHLTRGRIGWNVVTSLLDSAARSLGLGGRQLPHDLRYDRAQEFMEIVYRLWESSWEDGAVVRDRTRGIYIDPAKVHPIHHDEKFFQVSGAHLAEPSPQRTPVILQAGSSPRGREFAARNAEIVFMPAPRPDIARKNVHAIRTRAEELGRDPRSIKCITVLSIVTGADDAEAQARLRDFKRFYDVEGALAHFSAATGVDWSGHPLDEPLEYVTTDAGRTALAVFTRQDPTRKWTLRQIVDPAHGLGWATSIIGGPKTVADELERWIDEGDLDGFNLSYVISPGTFQDFITHVLPELRRRGRVPEQPEAAGTLRERVFGPGGPLLPDGHPGAAVRRPEPDPVI
jgi:long-chain alkane monooxygenase